MLHLGTGKVINSQSTCETFLADSVPRKSEYYVTKQRAARSRSIVSAYSEFVFHGDGWHHAAFGRLAAGQADARAASPPAPLPACLKDGMHRIGFASLMSLSSQ